MGTIWRRKNMATMTGGTGFASVQRIAVWRRAGQQEMFPGSRILIWLAMEDRSRLAPRRHRQSKQMAIEANATVPVSSARIDAMNRYTSVTLMFVCGEAGSFAQEQEIPSGVSEVISALHSSDSIERATGCWRIQRRGSQTGLSVEIIPTLHGDWRLRLGTGGRRPLSLSCCARVHQNHAPVTHPRE
jgi:hypothetical protein